MTKVNHIEKAKEVNLVENGELVFIKIRSVERIIDESVKSFKVDYVQEGFQEPRFLILGVKDNQSEPLEIGYIKVERTEDESFFHTIEEIMAKTADGEKPNFTNVQLVDSQGQVNQNISIVELLFKAELTNSAAFIESKNRDVEVQLNTSPLLYQGSAPIVKEIMTKIQESGQVIVDVLKDVDTFVASYQNTKFATVICEDEDFLQKMIDNGTVKVRVTEKVKATAFNGVVLRSQELDLLSTEEIIEQEKNRLISEGILTETEIQERIDYMQDSDLSAKQIAGVLARIVKPFDESRLVKPKVKFINYQEIVNDTVFGILAGDNILLRGPKSVGKNALVTTMAWLFHLPYGETIISPSTTTEQLFASPQVINDNGVPVTVYEKSHMSKVIEGGGLVNNDELNNGSSSILTIYNSINDDRQSADIANVGIIQRHPVTIMFGTMNPDYLGMKKMNEAVEDRFGTILDMENGVNLVQIIERKVGKNKLNLEVAEKLNKLYKQFFEMVSEGDEAETEIDEKVLTIRGFQAAYNKIVLGQDFVKAVNLSVLSKVSDKETRNTLFELVNDNYGK